jgi:hypothetical protein
MPRLRIIDFLIPKVSFTFTFTFTFSGFHALKTNKGSAVGIATALRDGRSGLLIPARAKRADRLWVQSSHRGSLPGVKRPGREVNHSLPSSAEVKNEWNYTSAPHTCLLGVDRENFTSYLYLKTNHEYLKWLRLVSLTT